MLNLIANKQREDFIKENQSAQAKAPINGMQLPIAPIRPTENVSVFIFLLSRFHERKIDPIATYIENKGELSGQFRGAG